MYKKRDCVARATKYNNAWSKKELLDECIKRGYECSAKLTKAQLCKILNSPQQKKPLIPVKSSKRPVQRKKQLTTPKKKTTISLKLSKRKPEPVDEAIEEKEEEKQEEEKKEEEEEEKEYNPCELPRDVRFKILLELPIYEVNKLCQIDNSCQEVCNTEEFWRRRTIQQYKIFDKPDDLSWKEYYKKLYHSGQCIVLDRTTKQIINLTAFNVIKCYPLGKTIIYIDIDNNLKIIGDTATIPEIYRIKNNLGLHNYTEPHLIMENVRDIYLGRFTNILLINGNMLFDGGKGYEDVIINSKYMISNPSYSNGYIRINEDNKLQLASVLGMTVKYTTLDYNIRTATISDTGQIFAVDFDNTLYTYHLTAPINKPGELNLQDIEFTESKLVSENVKSITASDKYIFIIDTKNKLWIYKDDRFTINDIRPRNYQGNSILADFNQDQYQQKKFRRVYPGSVIALIDFEYNLYFETVRDQLNIFDTNVVYANSGSAYICYIKSSGF